MHQLLLLLLGQGQRAAPVGGNTHTQQMYNHISCAPFL